MNLYDNKSDQALNKDIPSSLMWSPSHMACKSPGPLSNILENEYNTKMVGYVGYKHP